MNYHLKSKPKHEHRSKIIFVCVVFIILALASILFPNLSKRIAYSVTTPIWFISSAIGNSTGTIKNFFVYKNTLINEKTSLENEITKLKLRVTDYDTLIKENEDLKFQLGLKSSGNRIIARVLSKPPQSPFDTFVIDRGSTEGVIPGNKVYLGDTVIIGTVVNVTPSTSLIELFSSGNNKQQVISDRTSESFEAVGRGGGNLSIEVPKDTDILWGDSFSYSGLLGSNIGSVYFVDSNSQSSFKTVYLRVPGNIFLTQWVFIDQ